LLGKIQAKVYMYLYLFIVVFLDFRVDVTFVRNDGKAIAVKGKLGDNLLDVILNNNVDLDGFGELMHILTSVSVREKYKLAFLIFIFNLYRCL